MDNMKIVFIVVGAIAVGVIGGFFIGRSYIKERVITVQSPHEQLPPKTILVKGEPQKLNLDSLYRVWKKGLPVPDDTLVSVNREVSSWSLDTSLTVKISGTIQDGDKSYEYSTETDVTTKVRFFGEPFNSFEVFPPIVSPFILKLQERKGIKLPLLPFFGMDVLVGYHRTMGVGGLLRIDKFALGALLFFQNSPTLVGTYSLLYSKDFKFDAMVAYENNFGVGGVFRIADLGLGFASFYKDRPLFTISYSL